MARSTEEASGTAPGMGAPGVVTTESDACKAGTSGGAALGLWVATADGEDGALLLAAVPGFGMNPPDEGGAVDKDVYVGEAADVKTAVEGLYGDAVCGDDVIPEGI